MADAKEETEEESGDTKSIVLGVVCSLILSPITFHLIRSKAGTFQSDLLACILTIVVSGILIFIANNNLKQHCRTKRQQPSPKPERTIFDVFTQTLGLGSTPKEDQNNNDANAAGGRRKIDPKYFKPRFIYHELMSMWGTTYTVITWGSVLIIGGTIVATGRLAQKIKTKCTPREQSTIYGGAHGGRRSGTGRSDSFRSYSSSSSTTESIRSETDKSSMRRMASWTKRSFATAKRKLGKFVGSGMPRITGSMAALGDSEPRQS